MKDGYSAHLLRKSAFGAIFCYLAVAGGLSSAREAFPSVPQDDLGGTGGFAALHLSEEPGNPPPPCHLIIKWEEPALVDLVALIPARIFTASGLDPEFALPENFSVGLIDRKEVVVCHVAKETATSSDPVREGHPFVYTLEKPHLAHGLRIEMSLLKKMQPKSAINVAWSEVLCFAGDENIAKNASVTTDVRAVLEVHWHWRPRFLVDGLTPLGLPEDFTNPSSEIGWLSNSRIDESEAVWIEFDLEKTRKFNGLILYPVKRPSAGNLPGFGLPEQFRVRVSRSANGDDFENVLMVGPPGLSNPGHNPIEVSFDETEGRRVRLVGDSLWREFPHYPAFLGFSEVAILNDGRNIAEGLSVTTSDENKAVAAHAGRFYRLSAINDGNGPEGKLVSMRQWLLNWKQGLETKRKAHRQEVAAFASAQRKREFLIYSVSIIGSLGVIALFAIPLILKRRNKRQLELMRTQIARDLHDDVGSNLGSIQILAGLANQRGDAKEDLNKIARIARETVSAVRDVVWLLHPADSQPLSNIDHLRETAATMLDGIRWTFTADEKTSALRLDPVAGRNLALFFREALHNLIRHAEASSVEISAHLDKDELHLTIADDGIGISDDQLNQASCLRSLKYRAEQMSARLKVSSILNEGTSLDLRFSILPFKREIPPPHD